MIKTYQQTNKKRGNIGCAMIVEKDGMSCMQIQDRCFWLI